MTCPRCGAAIDSAARFCGQCGAPTEPAAVSGDRHAGPPTFPTPKVTHARPSAARRSGGTSGGGARMVAVPLAIVALGLLLLVAALALLRRMPTPPTPPAPGAVGAAATPRPTIPVALPAPSQNVAPEGPFAGSLRPRRPVATPGADLGSTTPPAVPPAAAPRLPPTPVPATPPTPMPTPTPEVAASYTCRGLADFDVSPEEAEVTVDGRAIGVADDWDGAGGGDLYELGEAGPHWVRLSRPGYTTAWIVIVVDPAAAEEVAEVDLELRRSDEGDADDEDGGEEEEEEEEPGGPGGAAR